MDRFKSAKIAGILGIFGNMFLLSIKGSVGFICHSQSMIADAFNSAGDIFASLMTFVGNKIASIPEDEDHNFGHGKSEYIFSLFISISMILVAVKLLIDAIDSLIFGNQLTFSIFLVIVCIITIVTKLSLFLYVNYLNKTHENILLKANAKDHFNDCIVTSCTLISILFSLIGIYWVDGIVGIGIAIWILYTGIKIFNESYNVLMDACIDDSAKKQIIDFINKYKEIDKVGKISSIPSGYRYIVILSICVNGNMSTFESHNLADSLEKDIKSMDKVSDVIIHVNPI